MSHQDPVVRESRTETEARVGAEVSSNALLTVAQVANILDVSKSSVYRYTTDPVRPLPACRIPGGRRTLVRGGDLLAWLEPIEVADIEADAGRLLARMK